MKTFNDQIDNMKSTSDKLAILLNGLHNRNESLVILMITLDAFLEHSGEETIKTFNEIRAMMKKSGILKHV